MSASATQGGHNKVRAEESVTPDSATRYGLSPDSSSLKMTRSLVQCIITLSHYCACSLLLHFRVRRSRGEMYSGYGRLCVYLSLAAFPLYCMDPDVSWGMVGGASCALLGGFAIDARVSLL